MSKALPKVLYVAWREMENDETPWLQANTSLETACEDMSPGEKRQVGVYDLTGKKGVTVTIVTE